MRMKIAFLAGTLGRGGAERQLVYMLEALKAEQIESRVLCLTKGEAFEKEIRELGVDVEWVGGSQNQFLRLGSIIGNIRKRPVDILQSAHFFTNIYTAMAGRILGIHNIGAIRSDMINEIASNGLFSKWQLRLPQKLIANSQIAIDRAIAKGIRPANISLVRNAVEIKCGDQNLSKDEAISILFAGRLVPQKRPELFIEMAARSLKELPNKKLRFIIAGDGPLRADLERLALDMGLHGPKFSFLGEMENMSEIYRKANILVLTSEHEGTPNVILEAMAYGLPVVATRVGGIPGIVNDRCGFLVDPANVEELTAAATKLIDNKELRLKLGLNGQEYVGKNHSIGYLQDRLRCIYSELLNTSIIQSESRSIDQ